MPLAEQQQSQSSALGNFIDQLRPTRVLQSTYVNTLPPSLQSEEYAYTLIDPPAKNPCNVMDTSFTELIAKPSADVADSPVNRTDNCLLSDHSILPDLSVFDPYHHPRPLHSQAIYLNNFPEIAILLNILSNLLPLLLYLSQHLNHKVKSSMPGQLIKLYSCDTTKDTDELPELPKLLKDKESVEPSHQQKEEEIPKPDLHGYCYPYSWTQHRVSKT